MPTKVEWAQLAAFIDGEGNVNVKNNRYRTKAGHARNYFVLSVHVTNSSILLMAWLTNTFGGRVNSVRKKMPAHWSECWRWSVDSGYAEEILRGVRPYLIIKTEQADIGLALRATVGKRGFRVIRDGAGHILGHHTVDPIVLEERARLKNKMVAINAKRGVVDVAS